MSNLSNKKENVNNQNQSFNYYSLNKRVFNELILISRPKNILFHIISYLACTCTYKNGLVGVHGEIYKTGLAKELGINDGHILRYLKQLEELKFIKIFNTSPLVLQVLEVPQAPRMNDIKSLLLYVAINPHEFNFNINLKRKEEFFNIFIEYKAQLLIDKLKSAEVPDEHPSNPTKEELDRVFGF